MQDTVRLPDTQVREEAFARLVRAQGRLCRYCDRLEHNEGVARGDILDAAHDLLQAAIAPLDVSHTSLRAIYADRLEQMELRNVLHEKPTSVCPDAIRQAKTWREIQIAQQRHDKQYHPDVIGLPKFEQVRHYTIHLGKLVDHMYPACRNDSAWSTFASERLIDMVVFSVKLATVVNHTLSDDLAIDLT